VKRLLDLIVAVGSLIVLSPLFLLIAILVRVTSRGPVFHTATRVGKDGIPFILFKFRSMRFDPEGVAAGVTTREDRRITPVGRYLRRWKLDELPQLINVVKGHMSLVGPRPEDPRYVALYTDEQKRVLSVLPGITGAASIVYHNEEDLLAAPDDSVYVERIMPHKLSLELEYVKRRSFRGDLALIIRTTWILIGSRSRPDPDSAPHKRH
jgi:lipopolysaccharide/colanic/teichoic acid biosynthesis glycosyltransferase